MVVSSKLTGTPEQWRSRLLKGKKVKKSNDKNKTRSPSDQTSKAKKKGKKVKKTRSPSNQSGKGKKGGKRNKNAMKGKLNACITAFEGSNSDSTIEGKIKISFNGMDMKIKYDLKNIDADLTVNSTGLISIDRSLSCDTEALGAHWNDGNDTAANPNPWLEDGVFYETNDEDEAKGELRANNGYYWGDNQGRALLITDDNREDIGCGILSTEKAKGC